MESRSAGEAISDRAGAEEVCRIPGMMARKHRTAGEPKRNKAADQSRRLVWPSGCIPNGALLVKASERAGGAAARGDAIVVVELAFVVGIAPGRFGPDRIRGRVLELALIDVNQIAAEVRVVLQ